MYVIVPPKVLLLTLFIVRFQSPAYNYRKGGINMVPEESRKFS